MIGLDSDITWNNTCNLEMAVQSDSAAGKMKNKWHAAYSVLVTLHSIVFNYSNYYCILHNRCSITLKNQKIMYT